MVRRMPHVKYVEFNQVRFTHAVSVYHSTRCLSILSNTLSQYTIQHAVSVYYPTCCLSILSNTLSQYTIHILPSCCLSILSTYPPRVSVYYPHTHLVSQYTIHIPTSCLSILSTYPPRVSVYYPHTHLVSQYILGGVHENGPLWYYVQSSRISKHV